MTREDYIARILRNYDEMLECSYQVFEYNSEKVEEIISKLGDDELIFVDDLLKNMVELNQSADDNWRYAV